MRPRRTTNAHCMMTCKRQQHGERNRIVAHCTARLRYSEGNAAFIAFPGRRLPRCPPHSCCPQAASAVQVSQPAVSGLALHVSTGGASCGGKCAPTAIGQ